MTNFSKTTSHTLIGAFIGLLTSSLTYLLLTTSATTPTPTLLHILTLGLLTGFIYPLLFQPHPNHLLENALTGLVTSLLVWLIIGLNLLPLLTTGAPLWTTTAAVDTLPLLISAALHGTLTATLYGLIYTRFDLHPTPTIAEPKPTTRVIIIGGGYAGVSAAQALDKAFLTDPHVEIWLISAQNYLLHTPMLSEVSASAVNAQNITPPLRSFFQNTQVVQAEVDRIDRDAQIVYLKQTGRPAPRSLSYHHLVITAGGVPHFFGNDNIAQHAFTFKSLTDSIKLRNQLITNFEQADVESDPERRQRLLTFVVAGGGFAGVELLGGLNDFGRGMLTYFPNITNDDVKFILIHSRDTILAELSPDLGRYAQEKMAQRGVTFRLNTRVTDAQADGIWLGDEFLPTNTFVWTAGNRPSPVLDKLGLPLTKRGQLAVNTELAVPDHPHIWAAGDCAQIPDLTTDGFCPPTAQHAVREGKVVGYNVAAAINDKPLKTFKFKQLGSLAALGYQLAVAEVFGYKFSGMLAWLMWRAIYLSKLPNFEKQLRVLLDWILDIFFPPDIVQTISLEPAEPTPVTKEKA